MNESALHLQNLLHLLDLSGHHVSSPVVKDAKDHLNTLKQFELDKKQESCNNGNPAVGKVGNYLQDNNYRQDNYSPPDIGCSMIGIGD